MCSFNYDIAGGVEQCIHIFAYARLILNEQDFVFVVHGHSGVDERRGFAGRLQKRRLPATSVIVVYKLYVDAYVACFGGAIGNPRARFGNEFFHLFGADSDECGGIEHGGYLFPVQREGGIKRKPV